jgi:hypothetical protein
MFWRLRLLVLLRRAAIALESLAASQAYFATERKEAALRRAERRKPRKTELGTLDMAAVVKNAQRERERRSLNDDPWPGSELEP